MLDDDAAHMQWYIRMRCARARTEVTPMSNAEEAQK